MANDTWFTRDQHVLDAAVRYFDEAAGRSFPQLYDLAEMTGLDDDDVLRAVNHLDGVYIDVQRTFAPAREWTVTGVYAEALVATGQWPSPDTMAAGILKALEDAAESEADEVERGRLKAAVGVLGDGFKDVGTNLLATLIARQMGLG